MADWKLCRLRVPADQIIFFSQVLIAYIVIIVSLINLCLYDSNVCLWSSLASGTIGYLLPNPTIKSQHVSVLSDTAV